MGFKMRLIRSAFSNTSRMALQRISLKTGWELSKPTGIFISVTHRCNLRCKQCEVPLLGGHSEELSTEQWKEVLRQLQQWLGSPIVRWSGGEPFLRKDMLELLRYSTELGLLSGVITNGQLIDKELAEQIVDAGTFNVSLSIDGMQKGHDFVRGQGAFAKAALAAGFLSEARRKSKSDMKIIVKVTIMETNLDEIVDLVDWVQKEGLTGVSISPLMETLAVANPDPRWFKKDPLWVRDLVKLDSVVDELIEKSGSDSVILNPRSSLVAMKDYFRDPMVPKSAEFTCHVGHDHFRIEPNGDVYLCPMVPSALVGSLVQNTPRQIWKSPEAAVSRKKIAACRKNCLVACQHKRTLGENFDFFLKLFKPKRVGHSHLF